MNQFVIEVSEQVGKFRSQLRSWLSKSRRGERANFRESNKRECKSIPGMLFVSLTMSTEKVCEFWKEISCRWTGQCTSRRSTNAAEKQSARLKQGSIKHAHSCMSEKLSG